MKPSNYFDIGHRSDGTCAIWWSSPQSGFKMMIIPKGQFLGHTMMGVEDSPVSGRIDNTEKVISIQYDSREENPSLRIATSQYEKSLKYLIRQYPGYTIYQATGSGLTKVHEPFHERSMRNWINLVS